MLGSLQFCGVISAQPGLAFIMISRTLWGFAGRQTNHKCAVMGLGLLHLDEKPSDPYLHHDGYCSSDTVCLPSLML